jgi:glucose dehydrogenase
VTQVRETRNKRRDDRAFARRVAPHLSRRSCVAIAALVPAAAGVTAGVLAYGATPSHEAQSPLGVPPELAHPGASDWPAPNHDLAGRRATVRSALTAANVSQLRVAWRFKFPEDTTAAGTFAGTPLAPQLIAYRLR